MTTIGVISDTHIKEGGKRQLPPEVFATFKNVDLILHAGDLNTLQVLGDLEAMAPVVAVYGNNDDWEAMRRLDTTQRIAVEDCVIGLVHGDVAAGPSVRPLGGAPGNNQTAAYALSHFPDADCVVFGHSHWPLLQWLELSARVPAGHKPQKHKRAMSCCSTPARPAKDAARPITPAPCCAWTASVSKRKSSRGEKAFSVQRSAVSYNYLRSPQASTRIWSHQQKAES